MFVGLGLRVGSYFLLDSTCNTSLKPHLQQVLPCKHSCHSWDLAWSGKSQLPCSWWLKIAWVDLMWLGNWDLRPCVNRPLERQIIYTILYTMYTWFNLPQQNCSTNLTFYRFCFGVRPIPCYDYRPCLPHHISMIHATQCVIVVTLVIRSFMMCIWNKIGVCFSDEIALLLNRL
jgi:hypothetical protein